MSAPPLIGIGIGAGYFSRFQYDAWQRMPNVQIAAIVNRDLDKGQLIAEKYDVPQLFSFDQLEEAVDAIQPDFVDIITPPATHMELCRFFADRKIPMICQKPLCRNIDEAKELVDYVGRSGTPFMVHENWRWQPWYREAKTFIESGELGELFSIAFTMRMGDGWGENAYLDRQPYFRDYPRLLVFETGVHFLDTFRFLGGEVTSVFASLRKRNPVIAGEDAGLIHCTFESGATAYLDASRYNEPEHDNARYTFGEMRIDGSKGHLRLDMDGSLYFKPLGEPIRQLGFAPSKHGFAGDCVYATQAHFVDRLLSGAPFESHGQDYLRTLQMVEACYRSHAQNQTIPIPA